MKNKFSWAAAAGVLVVALSLVSAPAATAQNPVEKSSFQSRHTVYCLDGYAAVSVHTNTCNGGNFQNFYWNTTPGIATPIKSVQEDLCLEAGPTFVWLRGCNSAKPEQRWNVNKGVTAIKRAGYNLCVQRTGGDGKSVVLATCNGLVSQQWVVTD